VPIATNFEDGKYQNEEVPPSDSPDEFLSAISFFRHKGGGICPRFLDVSHPTQAHLV